MPMNSYLVQIRAFQRSHLKRVSQDLRNQWSMVAKVKSMSGNRAIKKR